MSGNPDSTSSSIGHATESKENAQWWMLYAIMVANKSAEQTEAKLIEFLAGAGAAIRTPFERVEKMVDTYCLDRNLRWAKTGQYTRIEAAFRNVACKLPQVAGDDPREWTLDTIESVPGIGPKTARWFYLLAHPGACVAALDTHVLKFLRDQGHEVPKATPPAGATYRRLEEAFLAECERLQMRPRDLDWTVWSVYRAGGHIFTMDPPTPERLLAVLKDKYRLVNEITGE